MRGVGKQNVIGYGRILGIDIGVREKYQET